jgi:hypothetical protein
MCVSTVRSATVSAAAIDAAGLGLIVLGHRLAAKRRAHDATAVQLG